MIPKNWWIRAAEYPPGGKQYLFGVDDTSVCHHRGYLAVSGIDARGFGLLVNFHTHFGGPFGQAPDNRVMPHHTAGGMKHGPVDGKGNVFGNVQGRYQLLGLPGIDEMGFHPVELGGRYGHAGRVHGCLGMHEVEVAAVVEH
ncbi:MAG: hypothetical protein U5K27_09880 [Desulfotignum sp.]|nr:hypothetical protein [Desulfotignum sp.]